MMLKKIKFKQVLFTVLLLLFGILANAQEKSISGKVVADSDGLGLPGVNVVVKGTSTGTVTDFDGNYTINVSSNDAALVFSYIGFVTQEIVVGTKSAIDVTLLEDAENLDEVIVIGYGTTKKSDLTGSVSSVKSEELNAFPVLSAQQALQGRAAGVNVQSNNGGEPGAPISIRVRGNSSIRGTSAALIVVDGFVGAAMPQPADIESMEILKDASATAIYGSRGANGVILVTTKKGTKGKLTIELNSTYSLQNVSETIDMLEADEFVDLYHVVNPAYVQGTENTNWQDLLYRTGSTSNHQLAFSGGTENINFYLSGSFFDQEGIVINSGYERFTFLSNVDAQMTDKLKVGFNTFGQRNTRNGVATQASTGGFGSGDVISIAYRFVPDIGIFNEDGTYTTNKLGDQIDNPYAVAVESQDDTKIDNYRLNFYGDYALFDWLSFKSTFGWSSRNSRRGTYSPSTLVSTAGAQGGIAAVITQKRSSLLSENYFTFNKDFGKSNITLVAGYSYQKDLTEGATASAQDFVTNSFGYSNLGAGATILTPASSFSEREIISQYGRFNFNYDDRYLLTATARRDGSSNFAPNEKYAFFPSAAIGWNVSNESFLEDSNTISNLKLRASFGIVGDPSIGNYQSLALFGNIYTAINDQTASAVVPVQVSNPNLKWETSHQTNYGLDLGLFNNNISLTFDYYNIDTKDLIMGNSAAPRYVGFSNPASLKNIGEINNTGFEVTLSTKNITTENFSWTTDFNWATNKNEVVSLINNEDLFIDASPGHFLIDQTSVLREGEAVGQFYGYVVEGIYQGGTVPAGTALFDDDNLPGAVLYSDLDGDGVMTTEDRTTIGDPNQDWTFGLNNTFSYKNIDLNVFFQGAVGGDIFSFTLLEVENSATAGILRDSWNPTNTDTNVPAISTTRSRRMSSRHVYDGTYVRLKNLALGYNFPIDVLDRFGVSRLRLFVSGQNLLTFTDYPGTDPEVSYGQTNNQNSNTRLGFDYGNYPNIKSITLGLNVKF